MGNKILAWLWLIFTIIGTLSILVNFETTSYPVWTAVYAAGVIYINIKYIETLK